jgi:pimeloyl-ACP methyl ester carboxylesterase
MKKRCLALFPLLLICLALLGSNDCRPDQPPLISYDQWFPCSLYEGADDGRAECYASKMPLDWGNPENGKTVTVYVKRLLSSAGTSQLWLLHGGPGASGVNDFPTYMEYYQKVRPELDVYTLDYRGINYSDRLSCPQQEAAHSASGSYVTIDEVDGCIEYINKTYGDDIKQYSVSNSARDLAEYIARFREEGKKTLIWGGSFGTYMAQRYLQLFPDAVDGVVLEGVTAADSSLVLQDGYHEKYGQELLQMCADDPFCSAKFSQPPLKVLEALYAKLDNEHHCASLRVDSATVKYILTALLSYHPINALIPSLIYRFDRCSPEDKDAIVTLYQTLFGGNGDLFGTTDSSWSQVYNYNVMMSEMWLHPDFASEEELLAHIAEMDAYAVHFGWGGNLERNDVYKKWPVYLDSTYDNQWATSAVPILMLQGELDSLTPFAEAQRTGENFAGPKQSFLSFPYSPHNVATGSPISNDPTVMHCGMQLFFKFLQDPQQELDRSCLKQLLPINFAGTPELSLYLYGTADYWENEPTPTAARPEPPHGSLPAMGHTPIWGDFTRLSRAMAPRSKE